MTFREFDSFEDMLEEMHKDETAANKRTTAQQASITYGDYFVREWRYMWETLRIYGHVSTEAEFKREEVACGATETEAIFEWDSITRAYDRGYRWGRCYSVVEPEGEWGSTHVSTMLKITKEQFEEAKKRGWQ